jgi:HEAT repeat protein
LRFGRLPHEQEAIKWSPEQAQMSPAKLTNSPKATHLLFSTRQKEALLTTSAAQVTILSFRYRTNTKIGVLSRSLNGFVSRTFGVQFKRGPRCINTTLFRGWALIAVSITCTASIAAQDLSPADQARLHAQITSGDAEQKRDALFEIRNLRSEQASRIAVIALKDKTPVVRATAASSVVFLPKTEAVAFLAPLLSDKDVFVRREAAYALGLTRSANTSGPLIRLLQKEKDLEVKSAALIALGQAGDPSALDTLIRFLNEKPKEENEFLRRSATRSIGQIAQIAKTSDAYVVTPQNFFPEKFKSLNGDDLADRLPAFRSAVVMLSTVLQNSNEADDTRREAAYSLGAIGSRSASDILRRFKGSPDPYLAEICREALLKIERSRLTH